MNLVQYKIVDNGDSALTVIIDDNSSEELTRKIATLHQLISISLKGKLADIIPAYQSITILLKPLTISKRELFDELVKILSHPIQPIKYQSKLIEIPVCYEAKYAPDLATISNHCQLSEQQVITMHSEQTYLVHMLGFLPGFLYLGGLSPRLNCPRKNNPATRIPAGSVAISGEKTCIYPTTSPGGWHIIGRTPLTMFDPQNENPAIAAPLDRIKFVAIEQSEFLELQEQHTEPNQ
jgi:KipI family sensor histidine kinase inhibitor